MISIAQSDQGRADSFSFHGQVSLVDDLLHVSNLDFIT